MSTERCSAHHRRQTDKGQGHSFLRRTNGCLTLSQGSEHWDQEEMKINEKRWNHFSCTVLAKIEKRITL
jgi:hypothetical protein